MSLNKVKHIITEIDGVRCSVVEKGVSDERITFLKELLEHNNFEVKVSKDSTEGEVKTYTIAVTDILFNTVYYIYERRLKSLDGYKVTPAYWNQQTTVFDPRYWMMRKRVKRT
jgi:hypothetical protein